MSGAVRRKDGHGRLGNIMSGVAVALGSVLFLGGFVWGAVVYQPYTVPTASMTPTVKAGDRVLAQRIPGSAVHRGDVVVFEDPDWGDLPMVKRAVGVGGDKVACCDKQGRLTVNGTAVDEPYTNHTVDGRQASASRFEATVPAGQLFFLGDDRGVSLDSRVHIQDKDRGAVPEADVKARVDAVAWPSPKTIGRPAGFAALRGGVSAQGPLRLMLASVVVGVVLILGGAAYGPIAARRAKKARQARRASREVPAGAR